MFYAFCFDHAHPLNGFRQICFFHHPTFSKYTLWMVFGKLSRQEVVRLCYKIVFNPVSWSHSFLLDVSDVTGEFYFYTIFHISWRYILNEYQASYTLTCRQHSPTNARWCVQPLNFQIFSLNTWSRTPIQSRICLNTLYPVFTIK